MIDISVGKNNPSYICKKNVSTKKKLLPHFIMIILFKIKNEIV